MPYSIRRADDSDASQLIQLIGGVYAEYHGCVLDLDTEDQDLRAIASVYSKKEGKIWVAEFGSRIVGSVGVTPCGARAELKRLYVERAHRRSGLGSRLLHMAEQEASDWGKGRMILWSDSRFTQAHHFYQRYGYQRLPGSRQLNDPSNTTEFPFAKTL